MSNSFWSVERGRRGLGKRRKERGRITIQIILISSFLMKMMTMMMMTKMTRWQTL
jgi:hypothetical protein